MRKIFFFFTFDYTQLQLFLMYYRMNDAISSLVDNFWKGIGITLESVETVVDGEDVNIHIVTPDSALIIGMHGRSLENFSHILSRMIEKISGKYIHVHLEVNDYMKSKEERLFRFLESKIAFAMSTGKSVRIPELNSYDRKKAHNYIAEKAIAGLSTHSEWAGTERVLVLEYTGEIKSSPSPVRPAGTSTMSVDDLSEDGIGI